MVDFLLRLYAINWSHLTLIHTSIKKSDDSQGPMSYNHNTHSLTTFIFTSVILIAIIETNIQNAIDIRAYLLIFIIVILVNHFHNSVVDSFAIRTKKYKKNDFGF